MNAEWKELQRQLEKATAPGDVQPGQLDPETARFREAWTAFGRLLETAQPRQAPPLARLKQRPPSRSRHRLLAVAVALAASLLLCAAATWIWRATVGPARPGMAPHQTAEQAPKAPSRQ